MRAYFSLSTSNFAAFGAAALVILIGSCSPALAPLSPQQAEWAAEKWPEMTVEQLDNARTMYVMRCSGCHSLYQPAKYSLEKWDRILDTMAPKAKLDGTEREMVRRYIVTAHENEIR
jgi:hypothetical protein